MVKDLRYVVKRVLIGIGIALVLSALRGKLFLQTYAQTYYFQSHELCSIGYGCTSSASLPVSQSYANVVYSYSSSVPLSNAHTYSFSYYGVLTGKNITVDSGYPIINVSYNGSNYQRAYPDRYENLYVTYIGADRYAITWSFDMDIIGNFNTVDITYYFTSSFQNVSTSVSLIQSDLDVTDITSSGSNPNQDIINNDNSNTQNIINNQNSNTQNIINNNNNNTENIINNQNENTQAIIDSNIVCNKILLDSSSTSGYLNNQGTIGTSSAVSTTDYISINDRDIKIVNSTNSNTRVCYYNRNKTFISCTNIVNLPVDTILTIPNNAFYARFTIQNDNNTFYSFCSNGNQAIQDSITDDTGVSNSELSDLFDDISDSSNSPVSDLLTLPITLLQAYLTGFQSNCATITLGTLYGTTLSLPCIDIPHYIGNSLWSIIDSLFCLYMIYNIAMMCISIYESITSLDDSMQLLYTPQHANSRVARNGGTYNG